MIARALRDEPLLLASREPEILIVDFAASAVTYRVRVWTTDFAADMRVRDRVRSHIYYAFRRHGISIPYPIQVQIDQSPAADAGKVHAQLLDGVEIFASLTGEQREQLATASRALLFEAGQDIVRQDEAGASMFVLKRGEAAVTLAHTVGEVARHREGGFFGEMSLLTGDARSATVTAVTDCELIEIGADAFRRVVARRRRDSRAGDRRGLEAAARARTASRHQGDGAGQRRTAAYPGRPRPPLPAAVTPGAVIRSVRLSGPRRLKATLPQAPIAPYGRTRARRRPAAPAARTRRSDRRAASPSSA